MQTSKRAAFQEELRLVSLALLLSTVAACGRSNKTTADTTLASSGAQPSASSTSSSTTAAANAPIPQAINDVGTYGEDLYDEAKAGNWAKAKTLLDSLHAASNLLPTGDQFQSQRTELNSAVSALDKAIASRNRTAGLEAANRVTYASAKMTTPYHGATPTEVLLLDYYGRELEIWSAQKNAAKLKETAAALTSTWNALRPTVQRQGGTVAAGQTDALVKRINAAKSPAEYARTATPFLDEVDELEKVFTKQ